MQIKRIPSQSCPLTVGVMTGFVGRYGTEALAGYGLGARLELMDDSPYFCLAGGTLLLSRTSTRKSVSIRMWRANVSPASPAPRLGRRANVPRVLPDDRPVGPRRRSPRLAADKSCRSVRSTSTSDSMPSGVAARGGAGRGSTSAQCQSTCLHQTEACQRIQWGYMLPVRFVLLLLWSRAVYVREIVVVFGSESRYSLCPE